MKLSDSAKLIYPSLAGMSDASLSAFTAAVVEWIQQKYGRNIQGGQRCHTFSSMGEQVLFLPDTPVWPNKPLVIGGSIALGLALGLMLALLVELLGRRVRSDEDLEYAAGAPVLAIVGAARTDDSFSTKLVNLIDRKGAARRRALTEA